MLPVQELRICQSIALLDHGARIVVQDRVHACQAAGRCHNVAYRETTATTMAIGILLGVTVMMTAFAGIVIYGRRRGLL